MPTRDDLLREISRLTKERDAAQANADENYRRLMEERERCARAAEWYSNVENFTASQVAARIRSGKDDRKPEAILTPGIDEYLPDCGQ